MTCELGEGIDVDGTDCEIWDGPGGPDSDCGGSDGPVGEEGWGELGADSCDNDPEGAEDAEGADSEIPGADRLGPEGLAADDS